MKFSITLLFFCTLLAAAQNNKQYEEGKSLYYANSCANCHGTNGEGSGYYPKLANKKQAFLQKKLLDFKKGIATTQKQEIMFTFAKPLSQDDIENLTYFLANFTKEDGSKYDVEEDLLGVDY
ncbi:MAG: c-type cytochrome [Epsilonproteobacteria bacterium]|nr:c-type cytochrome [Campylobacterota bacterium]